jgi:hypothetical protein
MLFVEDGVFTIEFISSAHVLNEVENFLTKIEGRIFHVDDNEENLLVGKLRAFYADLGSSSDHGWHPYGILDLEGSTEPFCSALYDPAGNCARRRASARVRSASAFFKASWRSASASALRSCRSSSA